MKLTGWVRDPDNPILPVIPGTWRGSRVANCSFLVRGRTAYLYYRAGLGVWWQGAVGHEAIGLATCPLAGFDGKSWRDYPFNPIFTHGATGDFDGVGPIDPYVVEHDGTFHMFYEGVANPPLNALPADGLFHEAPAWVKRPGLATSQDGLSFHRVRTTPLEVDDCLLLMCVTRQQGRWVALGLRELNPEALYDQRQYGYFHYVSDDAVRWGVTCDEPALLPGPNSRSMSGARWFRREGWWYLVYGGTPHRDYPDHFGLARSRDLLKWTKHPEPIFHRGDTGQWDDGGIWVGDVAWVGDTGYLWYEGRGAGVDRQREYAPGGFSQVGVARISAEAFARWTESFPGQ